MGLQRQLQRWVQAGVLDPEAAKAIERYEASHNSFSIGAWILGLGIVAIGIGLVALVASNWDGISPGVKLGCDLLLLLGLGWAVLHTQKPGASLMRSELCIGILFFFTLASLALVGQVYQIDAPLARTTLTWFAITTPLLFLSKSSFLASLWALLGAAVYLSQIKILEGWLGEQRVGEIFLPIYIWCGPLLFRLLGALAWFRGQFPNHAAALRNVSDLASLAGAALCTTTWYDNHGLGINWDAGFAGITLVLIATVIFRKKLWPKTAPVVLKLTLALWFISWLSLVLGIGIFRTEDLPVVAAIFQLALLACLIALSIKSDQIRQFRFWVGAACLRLLGVYFEIFGSLLDTGIALIGGGILIVVLAALWRKWSNQMEREDVP